MSWVNAVYGKHPDSGAHPAPESVSGKQPPCATDWQYPEIPECYLRPELIPVEMPDKDTPEKADLFVRFMQQGKP